MLYEVITQTNVRRYMDRLRVEGESYYLDFMPRKVRQPLFDAWNKNLSMLVENKLYYKPSVMPTAVKYTTADPKREFIRITSYNVCYTKLLRDGYYDFKKAQGYSDVITSYSIHYTKLYEAARW